MKRFIISSIMLLIVAITCTAQNAYVKVGFGSDYQLGNNFNNQNVSLNAQVGYFYSCFDAIEVDYSHGFKTDKYGITYNRIGLNYLHEFNSSYYVAPIIKFGIGGNIYDSNYSDTCNTFDIRVGFGVHCYISSDVSINFMFDFSNDFWNEYTDIDWDWGNTLFRPQIGLSYNF